MTTNKATQTDFFDNFTSVVDGGIASDDTEVRLFAIQGEVVMAKYSDGEVIRLDTDGRIIQWDANGGVEYNCGETPEEFGVDNLTKKEAARLGIEKEDEDDDKDVTGAVATVMLAYARQKEIANDDR